MRKKRKERVTHGKCFTNVVKVNKIQIDSIVSFVALK